MFPELDPLLIQVYFWIFAGVSVLCGLGLLLARHPLYGAVNLIGVMLALSGLYAILAQPFLAVIQVLTYAGAIMMLVVFVIMVLNQAKDHQVPRSDRLGAVMALLPLGLLATLLWALRAVPLHAEPLAERGTAAAVAARLFDLSPGGPGRYLLFELVGVLLLVAVVAAVALAKRRLDRPADTPAEEPHGEH